MNDIQKEIRKHEDDFQAIFCTSFDFSDAFIKDEDDLMPLMYDHHRFITKTLNIGENDIKEAIEYQKQQGCHFLKIDSRFPLEKNLVDTFRLDQSEMITMVNLHTNDDLSSYFHTNHDVIIKDIQNDPIEEDILSIYLKNYQKEYGEEFIKQFVSGFSLKAKEDPRLHYLGAYLDHRICGYCYYFDDGHYKVLDGLAVNEESRHQYVASTLISHVINASDSIMYLHADKDDTPQQMYRNMGFEEIDILYEYICQQL